MNHHRKGKQPQCAPNLVINRDESMISAELTNPADIPLDNKRGVATFYARTFINKFESYSDVKTNAPTVVAPSKGPEKRSNRGKSQKHKAQSLIHRRQSPQFEAAKYVQSDEARKASQQSLYKTSYNFKYSGYNEVL